MYLLKCGQAYGQVTALDKIKGYFSHGTEGAVLSSLQRRKFPSHLKLTMFLHAWLREYLVLGTYKLLLIFSKMRPRFQK